MSPQILVVDDSPTIRKLLELSFRGTEVTLEFASTGREGVSAVGRVRPSAILLDYVLPDMRATDVCAALTTSEDRCPPILIMSGKTDGMRALFAAYPQVVDIVPKPFGAQDMVSRVRKVLSSAEPTTTVSPPKPAAAPPVQPAGRHLEGALSDWPVLDLLRMFGDRHFGELTLTNAGVRRILHLSAGEVVLVSTDDPTNVLQETRTALDRAPIARRRAAEVEQRVSGKPALVSLAEEGALSGDEIRPVLHAESRRLLLEAHSLESARFCWKDRDPKSFFAETYGRPISHAQMILDRLRQGDPDSAPETAPGADSVLVRTSEFSRKVRGLELLVDERRVLGPVDGRRPLSSVAREAGMDIHLAGRALQRLIAAGLVQLTSRRRQGQPARRERILIVEADESGVVAPLGAVLSRRSVAVDLIRLESTADVVSAALSDLPQLLLLNASQMGPRAELVARSLRSAMKTARLAMAAVLETPSEERASSLWAAGFDRVMHKPIRYNEIDDLLASAGS